ncbi:MAG TPA: HYR domain-containing protein [Gemmatimonadaceae bacterium]|nr:HYR domain-containing protein [Gemmatimonadaceae bacterium]
MLRLTAKSALVKPFKLAFAGALALAFIISCTESTAPVLRFPDSVKSVYVSVPDSVKGYWLDAGEANLSASANLLSAPSGAALSTSAAAWKYSVSHPEFAPEEYPRIVVPRESWINPLKPNEDADGQITDVPIGFDFNFYGNTYDKLNVYANGFVQFGPVQTDPANFGFFRGDVIPFPTLPNNIIAFAWTDWSPQRVDGGVRFETRGTAPNRRFLLQFNNVPEYSSRGTGPGLLMMQLVLEESTNTITIYTNTMSQTTGGQKITQGIENADGTAAAFDSIVNPITGVTTPRVKNMFSLTNDAVRFTPPRPPTVTPPANVVVSTTGPAQGLVPAIGACAGNADPGVATATDDVGVVSLVGVRSDAASLPLNAPYPLGVTTITWTATDTDGMQTSETQTVTVADKENPFIYAPANLSADNDPHLPSAVVSVATPEAKDNCSDNVTASPSRSDGAPLAAPFMVGVTKITWTAKDAAGNTSSAEQLVTVFDKEAPVISTASVVVPATSPNGAAVNFQATATDNVGVVSIVCDKASGSVFPIGTWPVQCTAADAAGNSATGTFQVTVFDAPTQIRNLMQYVIGLALSSGTTNPLVNQLQAALNGDSHVACVKMRDFMKLVSTKGREIPDASEAFMNAESTRILSVLDCALVDGHAEELGSNGHN